MVWLFWGVYWAGKGDIVGEDAMVVVAGWLFDVVELTGKSLVAVVDVDGKEISAAGACLVELSFKGATTSGTLAITSDLFTLASHFIVSFSF